MKDAVMTRTVNTRSGYVICFEWRRTRIQRNLQQRLSKKNGPRDSMTILLDTLSVHTWKTARSERVDRNVHVFE